MMRALLCRQAGGPETLTVARLPIPEPGPGEVRVSVTAAGLNFFDTLLIRGKYQKKADFPFSPCAEFAGIVDKIGPGVARFQPGQRVMGWIGWGAAREYVVIDPGQILPLPDGVREDAAAGLAVTYGTAFHAFLTRGRIQPGESVAVLGAAGGAGQAAIEVAKLLGARVIACASSAEKLAQAKLLGADEGVNYAETDLKQALKALTSMILWAAIWPSLPCAPPLGAGAISWSALPLATFRKSLPIWCWSKAQALWGCIGVSMPRDCPACWLMNCANSWILWRKVVSSPKFTANSPWKRQPKPLA